MSKRHFAGWRSVPPSAPPNLRAWLVDRDSLTAAVLARCQHLQIRVLSQGPAWVLPDEAATVGVAPGQLAWVREVALVADGRPWIWARSVASLTDLRHGWRRLAGLGARSLGAALFADRRVARGRLTSRPLGRYDPRQRAAAGLFGSGHARLWARRSVFRRSTARILVTEVFAPDVPAR